MLLDIFSLQGKLRNHRCVLEYGTLEKYPVAYYILLEIELNCFLLICVRIAKNKTLRKLASQKLNGKKLYPFQKHIYVKKIKGQLRKFGVDVWL